MIIAATETAPLEKCPALVLNADFRPLSYYPLSLWCWQDVVKLSVGATVEVVDRDNIITSLGYIDNGIENNGTINLSVSGGTSPYTFNWSTNDSTQNINGLSAGNYSVLITDVNNCQDSSTFSKHR